MTSKPPKPTDKFVAFVRVVVDTTVSLRAKTFEDALVEAKALKERDVVEFDGDFNDGSIDVTGVLKEVRSL